MDFRLAFYKRHKTKDGRRQVTIKVSKKKKTVFISTAVYLHPDQFLGGQVINHPNAARLNAELARQLYAIQSWVLDRIRRTPNLPLSAVRSYAEHKSQNFLEFARAVLGTDHRLAHSTKKRHNTVLRHLERFDKDVSLDDMDSAFFMRFDRYLMEKAELGPNTRQTLHKVVKRYMAAAARAGLIDKDRIPKFTVPTVQADRCALTIRELQALEELELNGGEKEIRDLFLFGCYTGLRFGDLSAVCGQNFRIGEEGLELHFRAQKTNKLLTLPLEILFNGRPAALTRERLSKISKGKEMAQPFWSVTNQHANRTIKDLALRAGIFKRVTMHVARHTFATILAPKIPTKLLQELLQHSDIKTTMVYVHLSNSAINESLKKAFKK